MPTDFQDIIDAIDAAILVLAEGGLVQSYQIGTRNLARMTVSEMMHLRREYVRLLSESARGSAGMQRTKITYVNPGCE